MSSIRTKHLRLGGCKGVFATEFHKKSVERTGNLLLRWEKLKKFQLLESIRLTLLQLPWPLIISRREVKSGTMFSVSGHLRPHASVGLFSILSLCCTWMLSPLLFTIYIYVYTSVRRSLFIFK